MVSTILHVAIDSFAIEAERLRCPKLVGRPLALAPADSARPRILQVSREARASGVEPGTPLPVARRLCRDLIALPPDPDLYSDLSRSIHEALVPFAPFSEPARGGGAEIHPRAELAAPSGVAFALDLTGLGRTAGEKRDRAARAGREVERAFRLHPTLGLGATRLVSRVAAWVLAPDGQLLDVPSGSEVPFLAPLRVHVLPTARERAVSARLDLLNVRSVGDVQALAVEQLQGAFGFATGASLWRECRGIDPRPCREVSPARVAAAEETLPEETNDRRTLAARLSRLVIELSEGLRARASAAGHLAIHVRYADGREGRAGQSLTPRRRNERELLETALRLLDQAVTRRVRVRRLRLEAREEPPIAEQLALWGSDLGHAGARAGSPLPAPRGASARDRLERALHAVRGRFGTESLVPAAWLAHGLVRPSARP